MTRRSFAAAALVGLIGCGNSRQRPRPPDSLTPDEKKAVAVAKALLAEHKIDWGDATAVKPIGPGWEPQFRQGPDCFVVVFPTPEKELPLLGDRSVIVNVTSGHAILAPRD